jgi:hypothetical protein
MASINTYKVQYHWENPTGVKISPVEVAYCQAAGQDYASLKAAIVTAGGKSHVTSSVFVVDSVQTVGVDKASILA